MLTACSRPADCPPALCSPTCTQDQKWGGPNKVTPANTGPCPPTKGRTRRHWGVPADTGPRPPTQHQHRAVPVLLDSGKDLILHVPVAEAAEQSGQDGALGDPLTLDVGPGGQDLVSRRASHGLTFTSYTHRQVCTRHSHLGEHASTHLSHTPRSPAIRPPGQVARPCSTRGGGPGEESGSRPFPQRRSSSRGATSTCVQT